MTAHTVQARASEWLMSDSGDGGDQLVRDLSDELASLAADVTRQRIVNAELVVERDCIRGERDRLAALNARLTEALTDALENWYACAPIKADLDGINGYCEQGNGKQYQRARAALAAYRRGKS